MRRSVLRTGMCGLALAGALATTGCTVGDLVYTIPTAIGANTASFGGLEPKSEADMNAWIATNVAEGDRDCVKREAYRNVDLLRGTNKEGMKYAHTIEHLEVFYIQQGSCKDKS